MRINGSEAEFVQVESKARVSSLFKHRRISLKVMMVVGTRPEVIKMAPLANELRKDSKNFDLFVCATGQHRELFDKMSACLDFKVDKNLNLMRSNQGLPLLTSKIINSIDLEIKKFEPDIVLVHGDTTSALSSSIAAFYNNVSIGHVEAGLRTFNIRAPFPEEFNRQTIGRIAKFNFAPTEICKQNLESEGVSSGSIFVTGNTIVDSINEVLLKFETNESFRKSIEASLFREVPLDALKESYILVTGHRRENFGEGFEQICAALREIAIKFPHIKIVYPVHLNPNVLDPVNRILGNVPNVFLSKPLQYPEFIWLMKHAMFVLTDSGGVQEEAPTLGIPILLMREKTERPEGLNEGSTVLVGSNRNQIVMTTSKMILEMTLGKPLKIGKNPYGDGFASTRIASILRNQS